MRHGVHLRKFSRNWSHRRAMLRNMATSFFLHGKFETTVEKAKELRPVVERLITVAKVDTHAGRRKVYSYLMDKSVVHSLFTDVGPRCKARNGGYTRVVRTGWRRGDAAEMAVIELVDSKTPSGPVAKAKAAPKKKAVSSK